MVDYKLVRARRFYGETKWTKYDEDIISLIQADMDFPVSDAILEGIQERALHPTFGYTDRGDKYEQAFSDWLNRKHAYDVKHTDIALSTGVMYSISAAIHLFSKEHEGVLIVEPTYPPFRDMIAKTNRKLVVSDLVYDGTWRYDFDDMEAKIDANTRVILLCNPHNPTGKIMDVVELEAMAVFCERHQLKIIVDEIHADFSYDKPHLPIMNVSEYTRKNTIACVSISKTFNVAGLKVSAVIIKDHALMGAFRHYASMVGIHSINIFGLIAVMEALYHSDAWLHAIHKKINANRAFVTAFIKENNLPIGVPESDGTYFMWLDFSALGIDNLNQRLRDEARIAFSDGRDFGSNFGRYQRLVLPSEQDIIEAFCLRLKDFIENKKPE